MFKHLCCLSKCKHNTPIKELDEHVANLKKQEAEQQAKWARDNNVEPFDMKEWYKRTGRTND